MGIDGYKISNDLVVTFVNENRITYHLSSMSKQFEAKPISLLLLAAIMGDKTAEKALESVSEHAVGRVLEELHSAQIICESSCQDEDTMPQRWKDWGEAAWFFHLASKDTNYEHSSEGQLLIAKEINERPLPPQYICHCNDGASEQLPKATRDESPRVWDVLTTRRTCRNFSDEQIGLEQLANLLFYTGGTLFDTQTDSFGRVRMKCAPSPGARHVTELYPVVRKVDGLAPGVYHYCSQHHAIALLKAYSEAELDNFLTEALNEQPYFAHAALTVLMTASLPRIMWKYRSPRVYRLVHFEVGHYAQNFLTAATAMGLGAFVTGATADSVVESAIGADGIDEIAMYAVGAGIQDSEGPYFREEWWPSATLPQDAKVQFPSSLDG